MAETEAAALRLKRHAQLGMVALGLRSVLQNVVILVANVYLARWLEPRDFGIFGIPQFALSFFRLVSDTGLGAALVQQKKAPEESELSTLWWLQLAVGLALTAASFGVAPLLPWVWSSLPREAVWLLPGLAVGLLFTMLQSVPFLVLERQVRFGWVGTLEFLGTVTFYGTALWLASHHAGPAALVAASVGQAALVSVAANLVQPWKPRLRFDFAGMRRLFGFGAAFQASQAVGFVNAAATPLIVGARLGSDALGVIQFAESTAFFPSLVVGLVRRVYFPYLCRLQSDQPAFQREFEQAVTLCAVPTFFFFGLFAGAAPAIVGIVYGAKWLAAVPSLVVYSFGFCFTFFSWIGDAALAALGDMRRLLRIKAISAALSWAATLVAVTCVPTPFAFAVGYAVQLVVTPLLMYAAVRRHLPALRAARNLRGLAIAALPLVLAGRLAVPYMHGAVPLVAFILVGLVAYYGMALAIDERLRHATRALWESWRPRKEPARETAPAGGSAPAARASS